MEALLIKHDMWAYVSGAKTKLEIDATVPELRTMERGKMGGRRQQSQSRRHPKH